FDLLGKVGNLEKIGDVVKNAAEMIQNGEVEPGKIIKRVLVIDEAQDMDENEFALIRALIHVNDDMRVIAVGDDDQNIFKFRGSDSKYLRALIEDYNAVKYEMYDNYRSMTNIVNLSNAFITSVSERIKSYPIQAVQTEAGTVEIIRYISDRMEQAVSEHVSKTYNGGKACVLTGTNIEALQTQGLLNKKGIRARLIQSFDGFRLYNLAEVRYFLKYIDSNLKSPVIDDVLWEAAKKQLKQSYTGSTCLTNCLNMLEDYASVNHIKYRNDLVEFIKESNYEDFYSDENEAVYVSTIHKAKGREFDTVYLLLKEFSAQNDEEKRKLYVALTRAKKALYIHCRTDIFNKYSIQGIIKRTDAAEYAEPSELSFQLTHRDVFLGFFKDKKEIILKLYSGIALSVFDCYLSAEINGKSVRVVKFSKEFINNLEMLKSKGYEPVNARIGFIVAWKGEEDEDESAVILPVLNFRKENTND
ncbi:MAG: 3'-5' exonuclease, partial [Eubacteriales bacterium]|nr:3'-5' exonuclease [Eubacteriales bacterium]